MVDMSELNALIPSEDVRRFVLETGYSFTDWQKAALFYHGAITVEEQFSWLHKLSDSTPDTKLKQQITEYLTREEQAVALFKENKDRDFLYIVKYTDEDCKYKMFFYNYEAAYDYGKKQGFPFVIEKHRPYTKIVPDDEYDNYPVADMRYDKNGNAMYFQSSEIPYCEDPNEEMNSNFRERYYEVPYIFEKGDIVRCVGFYDEEDEYGIVETSQKEYFEWENRIPKLTYPPDYSDVQVRVIFPNKKGTFYHNHINPIYLEHYNAEQVTDNSFEGVRNKLLLAVSRMYKGEAILDELYYWEEEYRRKKNK